MRPFLVSFCLLAAAASPSCRHAVSPEESETSPVGPSVLSDSVIRNALQGPVSFSSHVKPVLEANCLPCHDGREMPAFLNLSSRGTAFASGPYGPRIVPGKPGDSLLIRNLSAVHAPVKAMPPVGNRLTSDERRILTKWIAEGAPWPDGPDGKLRKPAL
jgi:hypothetical protein